MEKLPEREHPLEGPDETGFYSAYATFSGNLRVWLLAYGVGLPVLFFQSEIAWKALGSAGTVRPFVYLFLVGIALQIVSAIMYKSAMWYLYMAELKDLPETSRKYKVSVWISNAFWLDLSIDLLTIAAFGYATVRALNAVVG